MSEAQGWKFPLKSDFKQVLVVFKGGEEKEQIYDLLECKR